MLEGNNAGGKGGTGSNAGGKGGNGSEVAAREFQESRHDPDAERSIKLS